MEQKLIGVPETLLIPLWARAYETNLPNLIIRDEKAVEMVKRINYDFSKFEKSWLSQVGVAIRTEILEREAHAFLEKHPDALVVNLGAGLCTRFERVDNDRVIGVELDLPEVVELRKHFFTETDHHRLLAGSITDLGRMEQIPMHENQPPLLIAEGLFMYFDEPTVKQIFIALTNHFPEANLLCETLATLMVGQSKHHGSVLKMDQRPEFRWGITNAQDGTAFGSYESGIILTITESGLACSAGSPMYPGCDDR